jgi:hypothetical protein
MNSELAEEIARLAAPIYAAMVQAHMLGSPEVSTETQRELRQMAIAQAQALWRDVLEAEA